MATRAIRCQLTSLVTRCESSEQPIKQIQIQQRPRGGDLAENGKIVLQPRLCTLRSYGSEMIVAKKDGGGGGDEGSDEVELASPFFETLTDYIESSKKSQDFETISGRLAMVVETHKTLYRSLFSLSNSFCMNRLFSRRLWRRRLLRGTRCSRNSTWKG